MELRVWVEGIPRVVCGVSEATTCHDVVVALAHAIGKTGRYNLIEKWRDTERLLAPADSPIKSLHKWGEYAADVQYVLRHTGASGEKPRNPKQNLAATDGQINLDSSHPQILMRPAHCTNIKRNLTFSGAHSCSSASPLQVPKVHGKSSSHDNSSLESLEEQSSFTESHSSTSTSPYASFEGRRPQPDLIGHSYNSIERNRHLYSTQYSTSSAGSSPQETPVNSLERRQHRYRPSPLVHDSSSNKKDNKYLENRNNHSNHISNYTKVISSLDKNSTSKHKDTSVSDTQLMSKQTLVLHSKNENPTFTDTNEVEYHKRTNLISSSSAASSSSTASSSPVNGSNVQPATPPRTRHRQHNSVDKNNMPANSIQHRHTSRQSPTHRDTVGEVLCSGPEFCTALAAVDRAELLKLLNLQLEQLARQDNHMKALQAEILQLEKKHESCADCRQPSFSEELAALEAADQELEGHIEELELVSWEDKLHLEMERQHRLQQELAEMRAKLTACQSQLTQRRLELAQLSQEVEKETAELTKKEQDTKNHEIKLKQEMEDLKQQITQKSGECSACECEVARMAEEAACMDSLMEDQHVEERHLERQLADVNLEEFQGTPPVEMKTDVDKLAPFLTSASRPGSARKMLYNPLALKEAMTAGNTDPCWV